MTRVVILLHTLSYWGLTKALSGGDSFSEWAESHPDKWMNVPIITDSLGEEGRYKVHLLMQGLPHKIQKYTRAFGLTRIDKNPAFLTLIFPPPLKHLLTYIWQSVQYYWLHFPYAVLYTVSLYLSWCWYFWKVRLLVLYSVSHCRCVWCFLMIQIMTLEQEYYIRGIGVNCKIMLGK